MTSQQSIVNPTVCFCGETVSHEKLALIREIVARYRNLSRTELASTLCELLDWIRPNGTLKTIECRQFLEKLEQLSIVKLPAQSRKGRKKGKAQQTPLTHLSAINPILTGELKEFQPVTLRLVHNTGAKTDDRQLCRELIEKYHYLGYRVPFGAHLYYLIEVAQPTPQVVGCLQISSPAWRMAARDNWIGWEDTVRAKKLQSIVNNSRFLLLPSVKIKNLASHVLSQLCRCLAADWQARYHVKPVLLETLVDTQRFAGTCYRAANWIELGQTTGRSRQDSAHERHGKAPKTIFVYPLRADAVKCLTSSPQAV